MASSIPLAVPYFMNLCATALPSDSLVAFGTVLPKFTAPISLLVTEVVGNQEPAELGPSYRREETYSILCELSSFSGDQDLPLRLTEVFDAFALITVAVGNDMTLGQTVRLRRDR